jgi:hypothetical protein
MMKKTLQEHRETVIALAGRGEVILAINHLEKFEGMSHDEIIDLLVDCGAGQEVENNLHKFSDLHLSTVKTLIKRGVAATVWQNIDIFDPLQHSQIKTLLIMGGYAHTVS